MGEAKYDVQKGNGEGAAEDDARCEEDGEDVVDDDMADNDNEICVQAQMRGEVECGVTPEVRTEKCGSSDVIVGSLKRKVTFWEEMGASNWILKVITCGYELPFAGSLPEPKIFSNHRSARNHQSFVSDAIKDLVSRGCVRKVKRGEVRVCSPLGVVDNGKKLRLILDLRYVNRHLARFRFKLEDLKAVANVYNKGDYVVTFDLKSGYHHIAYGRSVLEIFGFPVEE